MKKIIISSLLLLVVFNGFTQDLIVKNSGDTVKCFITKIDEEKIYYNSDIKLNDIINSIPRTEVKFYKIYTETTQSGLSKQQELNKISCLATSQNATLISWNGSLINRINSSHSDLLVNLAFIYNYFVKNKFFIGVNTACLEFNKSVILSFGPQIGFTFNGDKSTTIPYFAAGIDFAHDFDSKYNAGDIHAGLGLIVPVKSHLGLTIELGENYQFAKFVSTNYVMLSIGMTGMFY